MLFARSLSRNVACRRVATFSTQSSNLKIGFAGLGNMGASMAANLVKVFGSNVYVYDIVKESVSKLVQQGATGVEAPSDLAKNCQVIVTMVPATQHVFGLLRGENGLFAKAAAGTLFIDCSTIDPLASKELNGEADRKGLRMIDAPVSGGVTGAAAGTLTFMVGGAADNLEAARVMIPLNL